MQSPVVSPAERCHRFSLIFSFTRDLRGIRVSLLGFVTRNSAASPAGVRKLAAIGVA